MPFEFLSGLLTMEAEEFFFCGPVDLAVAAFSSLKRTCSRLSRFHVLVAAFSTRRNLAAGKLLFTAFVKKVGFAAAEVIVIAC